MRRPNHDIHRSTIKQMASNQYNRLGRGGVLAPFMAGFFASLLIAWPQWLIAFLFLAGYAMYRSIEAEKLSVWHRFVTGWAQHIFLFSCGFAMLLAIASGELGPYVVFLVPIPLVAVSCYNRKQHLRAFHMHSARAYLREIRDISTVSP